MCSFVHLCVVLSSYQTLWISDSKKKGGGGGGGVCF